MMTKQTIVAFLLANALTWGVAASASVQDAVPETPHTIPHPIADFLPLTNDKVMCQMCHREVGKQPVEAHIDVPMWDVPASHFTKDGKWDGARNNCVMCHAPMTEFSSFKPSKLNERPAS